MFSKLTMSKEETQTEEVFPFTFIFYHRYFGVYTFLNKQNESAFCKHWKVNYLSLKFTMILVDFSLLIQDYSLF